jgi:hypothetical protein
MTFITSTTGDLVFQRQLRCHSIPRKLRSKMVMSFGRFVGDGLVLLAILLVACSDPRSDAESAMADTGGATGHSGGGASGSGDANVGMAGSGGSAPPSNNFPDATAPQEDAPAPMDAASAVDQRTVSPPETAPATDSLPSSVCMSGQHRCGAACLADDDVDHCGPSCDACPAGNDRERRTCTSGVCATACLVSCSENPTACGPASFNFESGSDQGVTVDEGGVTEMKAHGGRYSAASRKWFKSPVLEGGFMRLSLKLCSGTTNLKGRTFSAWVYLEGADYVPGKSNVCSFGYLVPGGYNSTGHSPVVGRDTWFRISASTFVETETPELYVICWVQPAVGNSWSGVMYVDDVRIE